MARLSLVVPFYDETPYLPAALDSILAEGIDGIEVILVNDNPARFDARAMAALGLPRRVAVVHHPENLGLSAARNTGIAAASGDWIGFLDADDWFVPGGLAGLLDAAARGGADITHAQTCLTPLGSVVPHVLPRDAALFARARSGPGLAGIEDAQFITSSWSSLYRRAFLDAAGLRFDPAQTRFEDRLFVLGAVTAAGRITVTGRPARVWRRRAGSISVAPPDAATWALQVALLEKCVALMRAHAARPGVPPRFLRRELYNTLARLIWDMTLVPALAAGDPAAAGLGPRVSALWGEDRFGAQIFDDPVLRHIDRTGRPSRHGVVRRTDVFAVHAALRTGDFRAAEALLAARALAAAAPPAPLARRRSCWAAQAVLTLHLGLHKTGTTWLQGALAQAAPGMIMRGILYPQAGRPADWRPMRPEGDPGHQRLAAALHSGDPAPWEALEAEIARQRPAHVVLSCENLLFPRNADRADLIARLLAAVAGFAAVRVVAFVRRPDVALDRLYREAACNGARAAGRGAGAFAVDAMDSVCDLPALFAPFEAAGHKVALGDYDAVAEGGLWPAFWAAAGEDAPPLPAMPPRLYASPHRAEVAAAQALCALIADPALREPALRTFLAAAAADPVDLGADGPLLPPEIRLAALARFAERSAAWAAARGYAPDLAALAATVPPERPPAPDLPAPLLARLIEARLRVEPPAGAAPPARALPGARAPANPALTIRIRPRPWLAAVIARLRGT